MTNSHNHDFSRRDFVKAAVTGAIASAVSANSFPSIVPASVLKGKGPSNRINVGAIGTGRISRGHDLPGVWRYDDAQVIAVCDLDKKRLEDARRLVNDYYAKNIIGTGWTA